MASKTSISRTLPRANAARPPLYGQLSPRSLQRRPARYHHHQQLRCISAYGYEQAKALTFTQHGEPADVLHLHTHSIPPAHSSQLTLRFLASPVNPSDINQIQGVYPSKPSFTTALGTASPLAVAGNEGVAEVLSAGSQVRALSRGDWVIMRAPSFGTWRTHAQAAESALLRIPDRSGITPAQAGTVGVNPCTAYRMLRDFADLRPGDWFVQNGANSAVGRAAIQLGKLWGFRSINVVRARDAGMDELQADLAGLGADVVVTDEELQAREFRERVAEWTDGGRAKVRLGLNCVGGKPAVAMAKVVESGGTVVTYGAMSKAPLTLPASLLIFKDVRFAGFWVSKWAAANPERKMETVEHLLDLMRDGKFKDVPMDEVKWNWETSGEELIDAVKGTLEGYRKGKSIFVFGET